MRKVTSKLLTLLLSFAMVITSVGWLGASEVKAAEGDTVLTIKIMDGQNAVSGEKLILEYHGDFDNLDNYEMPASDGDGLTSIEIEDDNWGVDPDYYTVKFAEDSDYSCDAVKVVVNDAVSGMYFDTVNGQAYSSEEAFELAATKNGGDDPDPQGLTPVEDFNKLTDATIWDSYGIAYTDINFNTDMIVDVRNTDDQEGAAPYVDLNKDPHFVFSNSDCVNVTGGVTPAVEEKLDTVYNKAKAANKKIVLICYKGQTMAKRAMQYFNTKEGVTLGPDGEVTYLIGGATGVTSGPYANNLGVGTAGIDMAKDVIIDVRAKKIFEGGHILGSFHADVTDEGGAVSDADKAVMDDALAAVPEGGKLVIVCNSGNSLAYKAMAYYMDRYSGEDLQKVSYLINGAKELKAGAESDHSFGKVRERAITTEIDMSGHPADKKIQVWVPVPQTDAYQTISNEKFDAPKATKAEFTTEDVYDNKMLYLEWDESVAPADRKATLTYDAKRNELTRDVSTLEEDPLALVSDEFISLKSNKVDPEDEFVQKYAGIATAGQTTTLGKARAIYDWIIANLERLDINDELEKDAAHGGGTFIFDNDPGCGAGNPGKILKEFDVQGRSGGHCTDLNSTFVAMCRASGIPAREVFGIRIGDKDNENCSGYQHCWAMFYLPGTGWVLADPGDVLKAARGETKDRSIASIEAARNSDTVKAKQEYYFGTVDENRIELTHGRDVVLNPAQPDGSSLNTFGYPCAFIGGTKIEDCTKAAAFIYKITSNPVKQENKEEEKTPVPAATPAAQTVTDGQTATDPSGSTVKVISATAKTAAFTKAANKKSVKVPDTVTVNGQTLTVTQVGPKAFTGKKIRTVTIGKNVNKIAKNAFKGSKATKMIVKSKKLKKSSVKGSLKGSKIKTVQVKVGKKKDNKKYVKKYKKIFTKKNAGKKVKIR